MPKCIHPTLEVPTMIEVVREEDYTRDAQRDMTYLDNHDPTTLMEGSLAAICKAWIRRCITAERKLLILDHCIPVKETPDESCS